MSSLQLRYEVDDAFGLTLRPVVDGEDLLAASVNDVGLDPDALLPPLSSGLLPTTAGREVVVGRCGCGEVGCGSFAVVVRRDGDEVVWEATTDPVHATVSCAYRFGLREYLDAIDDAAASPPVGEGRGRRAARAVRVMLARDMQKDGASTFRGIGWVAGWPWDGELVRAVQWRNDVPEVLEFTPMAGETDPDFAARIRDTLARSDYA